MGNIFTNNSQNPPEQPIPQIPMKSNSLSHIQKRESQSSISQRNRLFCIRRITNEKKDIEQNPPSDWKIISKSTNRWDVWITTDINTPFHSIPFRMFVNFPDAYPHEKPELKLQNFKRFYHPNIKEEDGTICQPTVTSTQPSTTIRQRIDAFIVLLEHPNDTSAYNFDAAQDFQKKTYYRKALHIFRAGQKYN